MEVTIQIKLCLQKRHLILWFQSFVWWKLQFKYRALYNEDSRGISFNPSFGGSYNSNRDDHSSPDVWVMVSILRLVEVTIQILFLPTLNTCSLKVSILRLVEVTIQIAAPLGMQAEFSEFQSFVWWKLQFKSAV